jgi:Notch-like protein
MSLETGIFPDQQKEAKIIPIFKTDEADIFTNYRPISILSSFSKIYERVKLFHQFCSYSSDK